MQALGYHVQREDATYQRVIETIAMKHVLGFYVVSHGLGGDFTTTDSIGLYPADLAHLTNHKFNLVYLNVCFAAKPLGDRKDRWTDLLSLEGSFYGSISQVTMVTGDGELFITGHPDAPYETVPFTPFAPRVPISDLGWVY